jgi:hypothetical protein
MKTHAMFAFAVLCLALSVSATRGARPVLPTALLQDNSFQPGCTLPFDAIKVKQDIDGKCPKGGQSSLDNGSQPHVLLSLAKNNFCVEGDPTPISYNAFVALQTAIKNIPGLSGEKTPSDRSVLQNLSIKDGSHSLTIGEGSKVSFAGFVMAYEFADADKGEDVNCDLSGDLNNDIHITFRTTAGLILKRPAGSTDPRCNSVSAEVSPHFRPAAWQKLASASSNAVFKKNPLRITGVLTYDSEHKPCINGKPSSGSPVRISVWEIHPVYAVDVCKNTTLSKCDPTNNSVWTPFDKFKAK